MGQYDMSMENGKIVVKSGNKSKFYDLKQLPDDKDMLVIEEKENILGQINLEKLLQNLDISVDLLGVAYNAVNSMQGLQKGVSNLQMRLKDTLTLSKTTVLDFKYGTDDISWKLLDAYNALLQSDEEGALEILCDIQDKATEMRESSEELGNRFGSMANDTEKVLNKTIEENADRYAQRDAVMEDHRRMEAETAAFETLKKNYAQRVQELTSEYSTLQKRQEKQEERAFALQLTGAILGALGMGVQAAMHESGQTGAATPESATAAQAQADLEAKKKEQEALEQELAAVNKEIAELDAKLEDKKDSGEHEKLKAEKERLTKTKEEKTEKLSSVKTQVSSMSDAVKDLGSSFGEMGKRLSDGAEKYNNRLEEVFKLKRELEEKERDNLAKLAEYTKKIANAVITKDSLDAAISSLVTAVGCLRQVVSNIKDMVEFWKSIEACCKVLASEDTIKKVQRVEMKFTGKIDKVSLEVRVKPYKEFAFMRSYLVYMVRWVALNQICSEYLKAVDKTSGRLSESIKAPEKTREEHWKDASVLAENLGGKIELLQAG